MGKIAKPDSDPENDGDDVPLSNQVAKRNFVWKWNKRFEKPALKKYSLAEEGIVNINLENLSSFQVFIEKIKIESERYGAQNGRVFQTKTDELAAFLGINILMGINRFPVIKDYWFVEERLGSPLIQKVMTRARFCEILQSMYFADNPQNLPQEIVSNMIVHGNSDLCLTIY